MEIWLQLWKCNLQYESTHVIIEVEKASPVDVQNRIERMPASEKFLW